MQLSVPRACGTRLAVNGTWADEDMLVRLTMVD